ncbi:hypothetical protein GmHk_03G007044 [Glycine max]|nr:hypothetical protein GmHk_03G007044 [Glycine max]
MASFHGCHTNFHGYHSLYGASMAAFHGYHSPYGASTFHYHHPHYSSPNEASMAAEDRLEAILTKLDAATRRLDSQLDALLLRLPRRPVHHYPPQSPCSTPIQPSPTPSPPLSRTPPPPPPFPAQPPLTPPSPLLLTTPPPPPLKPTPPPPALRPNHAAPLPVLFSMPVLHFAAHSKHQVAHASSSIFNQLGHTRVVASLNNLSRIVVHYGREAAPHDKLLGHRDMALLEKSNVPYGSTLVARERQSTAFALGTVADPKDPHRYRPWDPGGPRQTQNTLTTRDANKAADVMAKRALSLIEVRSDCIAAVLRYDSMCLSPRGF